MKVRVLALGAFLSLWGCGSVTADEEGAAPNSRCPKGRFGGNMLELRSPDGIAYCIDTHEVTVAAYMKYLATNPPPIVSTGCVDERPEPAEQFEAEQHPALPMHYVKWCEAEAFCNANGKRLCGKIRGGPLDGSDQAASDPSQSEWFNACSAAGTRAYAYGDAYDPDRCSPGTVEGYPALEPPGTRADCEGGFPGLFDMEGNVIEYENNCRYVPPDPQNTEFEDPYRCAGRGPVGYPSGCATRFNESRGTSVTSGIRCCADVIAETVP